MGFLMPKAPKPVPPANPATPAIQPPADQGGPQMIGPASSLITTSAEGLKRKPNTQRTSLLGGS